MSYHPFKMQGSYIGLVLGFIVSYLSLVGLSINLRFNSLELISYFVIFAPLVIGFLLGWSFHSLVKVTMK